MTQSTIDTIAGIVRAILVIVGIIIGKDLPINDIVTHLLPVITGIWAIFEIIKGFISNSKHVKK